MTQTHFGFKKVAEGDKAHRVRGVFDSVASKYDLMNDLMSVGMHRAWKAYAVLVAGVRSGDAVLDIAGGTGDMAQAFAKQAGSQGLVVHTDINLAMLRQGRDRLLDEGLMLPTTVCDAEGFAFCRRPFQPCLRLFWFAQYDAQRPCLGRDGAGAQARWQALGVGIFQSAPSFIQGL